MEGVGEGKGGKEGGDGKRNGIGEGKVYSLEHFPRATFPCDSISVRREGEGVDSPPN